MAGRFVESIPVPPITACFDDPPKTERAGRSASSHHGNVEVPPNDSKSPLRALGMAGARPGLLRRAIGDPESSRGYFCLLILDQAFI